MKKNKKTKPGRPKSWTPDQEKIMREKFPVTDNRELAAGLGVSVSSVRNKAIKMGLRKQKWFWTKKEEKYLMDHVDAEDYSDIADRLGKTRWSVINKYRELTGLR